ncbi:cleavage and polyadenylation specificity factor subunit 4-like [Patiria miniata]|uniref:Cleavage and polyadenylation specificity factor subunit 4 n=1 Tax=Patiria miniata TaxID=46514 RepID=A0A914AUY7_PATMI|nr:cleavage and polyadenylation specificity factor subunit 4-like [Patiria miniata]
MENIVANVEGLRFDLETALEQQIGSQPLPFPGMDKSGAAVCQFYKQHNCSKGPMCPYRHVGGEKSVVCKHWLRGLCKKGDECEFLHQYDMTKMPECFFFTKFGMCSNKECPFLHIDPESKVRDCPWYDRGFCKHGPQCKNRHVRRVMCQNYLNGFCLEGPNCKFQHPKFDLPVLEVKDNIKKIICHTCKEAGHKAVNCPKGSGSWGQQGRQSDRPIGVLGMVDTNAGGGTSQTTGQPQSNGPQNFTGNRPYRNLENIKCFKCGELGHFANKCPKGYMGFLNNVNSDQNQQPNRQ